MRNVREWLAYTWHECNNMTTMKMIPKKLMGILSIWEGKVMEKVCDLLKQAGYDDCLINFGDNFETMLNMLISGERGKLQIVG